MIVAVSDFNMGAMENKGLNVFNDKYVLAAPETATDGDFASIEAIIAHEYFHNWTGNRITCRDWFQLCLKEGLTVFRDQEFTSDQRSRAGQAHRRRARPARASVRRGRRPPRPSGAARALSRDQQLLHRDGLREGRRGRAHAQDAARRRSCSARAWTSISSATTARPRPSSSSCSASPTRAAATSRSSCAGTRRPARPRWSATGSYDAAAQDLPARPRADAAADAGPADQGADGHPARARPRRPRRPRPAARRSPTAQRVERGVLIADEAGADASCSPASPSGRCCRSTAASRRRSSSSPISTADDLRLPRRARQRSVQPLAGGADARDRAAGRQRRARCAPARIRDADEGLLDGARRDPRRHSARAGLRRARR